MSDCVEVLFASDENGQFHSAKCFDPHIGSATLMTYKGGGGVRPKTLSLIGKDCLISANMFKPVLHVWALNSQEPMTRLKMVMPGKVTALAVNPESNFCIAGIDAKIYIWEISSGRLLNVINRHFQSITKIMFTDDSTHFITAGEDASVLVWKLSHVIAEQTGNIYRGSSSNLQPVYSFTRHHLPVTDMFLGRGNMKGRLFTVSSDQTCKIYSMQDGCFLLSIVFDFALTAVALNAIETFLFVGTDTGKIQAFNLEPYPRSLEHHVSESGDEQLFFNGHEKAVTCLSTSIDGRTLASGSADEKVMLWDIPSRQMMKCFELKGSVTNVFFSFASQNIFAAQLTPSLVINNFERITDPEKGDIELNILDTDDVDVINLDVEFDTAEKLIEPKGSDNTEEVSNLKQEIARLKQVNKQLYEFAMDKIITNPLAFGKNEGNSILLSSKKKQRELKENEE